MITRSIPPLPEAQPTLFDELSNQGRELEDPNSVDRLSHLHDLRNAINYFSAMDASGVRDENDPADTVARRRSAQQVEHDLAYAHFARAYFGAAALRHAGVYEPNSPEHKEAWTQFTDFKRLYESPKHAKERNEYWHELTQTIAELEGDDQVSARVTLFKRRAPDSAHYPKELGEGDEREATLTTREKLQALQADERAGFLPATHREKTAALSLLNYLDTRNPLFSKRQDVVDKQLAEIYDHQINESNKKYEATKRLAKEQPDVVVKHPIDHAREAQEIAVDSVRSVINEWDDYRSNALYSMNELGLLQELATKYGNPRTTLAELLAADKSSIDPQPFLRYLDLRFFRDKGELPSFDPLRTREIRPAPPEYTSKNKIVVDCYLNVPDKEKLAAEFTEVTRAITVKTLRELLPDAIRDSSRRHAFFTRVLHGITGPYGGFAQQVTRKK